MWQPNRAQWRIIWVVAVLLILGWPPAEGRSLGVKLVNWAADPRRELPSMPEPLPMGLGDDADAVGRHDEQLNEYYRVRDSSAVTRFRMRMKDVVDPWDPVTGRQLLVGLAVIGALAVWRQSR